MEQWTLGSLESQAGRRENLKLGPAREESVLLGKSFTICKDYLTGEVTMSQQWAGPQLDLDSSDVHICGLYLSINLTSGPQRWTWGCDWMPLSLS